jgi:hypothetical protein
MACGSNEAIRRIGQVESLGHEFGRVFLLAAHLTVMDIGRAGPATVRNIRNNYTSDGILGEQASTSLSSRKVFAATLRAKVMKASIMGVGRSLFRLSTA